MRLYYILNYETVFTTELTSAISDVLLVVLGACGCAIPSDRMPHRALCYHPAKNGAYGPQTTQLQADASAL